MESLKFSFHALKYSLKTDPPSFLCIFNVTVYIAVMDVPIVTIGIHVMRNIAFNSIKSNTFPKNSTT